MAPPDPVEKIHPVGWTARLDESYESAPSINGREIRARFQLACAIAHGVGSKMSANELMELVMERGLPNAVERERILAARFAEESGDNTSSS